MVVLYLFYKNKKVRKNKEIDIADITSSTCYGISILFGWNLFGILIVPYKFLKLHENKQIAAFYLYGAVAICLGFYIIIDFIYVRKPKKFLKLVSKFEAYDEKKQRIITNIVWIFSVFSFVFIILSLTLHY